MKRCPKLVWQCLALVAVCLVVREPADRSASGSAPAKPPAVTKQAPAQFAVTNGFKQLQVRAKQGEAGAQTSLGAIYARGQGAPQDFTEALKWFRKAAEKGDASAQVSLGVCYANGQGVSQDYAEAVEWFRKAAEQGDAQAQYQLAARYANGQGVALDYMEAHKWANIAIAHAKPADCLTLHGVSRSANGRLALINGLTLENGESGLVKTPIGQIRIKCISIQDDRAQILVEGERQTRTLPLLSASRTAFRFQDAANLRGSLERMMSSGQIAEAQRRASVFLTDKEGGEPSTDDAPPKP
jgi:TPR repeat protein